MDLQSRCRATLLLPVQAARWGKRGRKYLEKPCTPNEGNRRAGLALAVRAQREEARRGAEGCTIRSCVPLPRLPSGRQRCCLGARKKAVRPSLPRGCCRRTAAGAAADPRPLSSAPGTAWPLSPAIPRQGPRRCASSHKPEKGLSDLETCGRRLFSSLPGDY